MRLWGTAIVRPSHPLAGRANLHRKSGYAYVLRIRADGGPTHVTVHCDCKEAGCGVGSRSDGGGRPNGRPPPSERVRPAIVAGLTVIEIDGPPGRSGPPHSARRQGITRGGSAARPGRSRRSGGRSAAATAGTGGRGRTGVRPPAGPG